MYKINMEKDLIYRGLPVLLLTTIHVVLFVSGQDIPVFFFSKNPQSKNVVEGTETRLQCDVSDRTNIRFHWTLNDKPLTNTSRRFQEDSNLRILRVLRGEDDGGFRCIATTNVPSAYSIVSQEATLDIQWINDTAEVQLRRPKTQAELVTGTEMMLRCQVTGNPQPSYLWYRNKFRIFPNNQIKTLDEGSRLRITDLSPANNGVYSCRAENVAGARDSSSNLLLNLKDPNTPHLIESRFTEEILVRRGATAVLDCPFLNATGINWYTNYEKLANNSRHLIYNNGSLFFPRVRPADEGSYRCEALSRFGTDRNQEFSVDLGLANLEEFNWNSFEPRLRPNFPIVIPVNEKFQIKCFKPDGKPEPTLRWLDRNGLPVGKSGRISMLSDNLVFDSAEQRDSGNYTCVANNMAGEKRKSVWVIVSIPPIVTKSPQPKQVEEEQTVKFQCQFTGTRYPVTTITWTKDNNLINPLEYPRHRMDLASGLLEIFNAQLIDAGNYACQLNTSGHPTVLSSSAYLTVKRKLKILPLAPIQYLEYDNEGTVHCRAEAETEPTIRWVKEPALDLPKHLTAVNGMLLFNKVRHEDAGTYMCVVHSLNQGFVNLTIQVAVVVKPVFQVRPQNMTVQEEQTFMIHCLAVGDPRPTIVWDRNSRSNALNSERFQVLPNGTLSVKNVLLEDKGKYGCTANNSGGMTRVEVYLDVASATEYRNRLREKEEANKDSTSGVAGGVNGMGMMKTVIIAVCSAGAYLALVIGLTAFCSYRLLMQRRTRKAMTGKGENGELAREQMELLHKDQDRESTTQVKSDSENRSHISGMSSQPSHSSQSQSRSRRGSYDRLQFPRHDLHTIGMLGKGIYGNVFLAKAQGIKDGEAETLVVVKSLLTKDEHIFFEFRQEMDMYSRLENPNVVKLLGVCRESEPHFIMTEYCDWGDLKQFLLATRQDNGKSMARVPPLTTQQKLSICKQVALGMEHLSNYRFIHKDMAARNILLTSHLDVKVSSLSLCQDIYASEYYLYHQALIPLRWMPPEAVLEEDYSTKSDVWSYGVFMWEVFHFGDMPHKGRTDEEVLKGMRAGDVTLEIRDHCPEEVTYLIRKCTRENPRDRPAFGEICIILSDIMMDNCSVINSV